MNLNNLKDQLIHKIQNFGAQARDHRQVHKRLVQLLPDRLRKLAADHGQLGKTSSDSMREALVSAEYQDLVQEILDMGQKSLAARIQYETHMMLFDAKQSLGTVSRPRR